MCKFGDNFLFKWGKRLALSSLAVASIGVNAAPRADVDLDDDGLIEIFTLSDLDSVRNHLAGTAFSDGGDNVANNIGCLGDDTGATNCTGYELMNDLDFDTDGSGDFSAGDQFYNGGEGWIPIGRWSLQQNFSAVFDGNYFTIANLTINRPSSSDFQGLFDSIIGNGAELRRLFLTNADLNTGTTHLTGIAAGYANSGATLSQVSATGSVVSTGTWTGCVIGGYETSVVVAELFGDCTLSGQNVGGIVGGVGGTSIMANSYSYSTVVGSSNSGGLIGASISATEVLNSYAAGAVTPSAGGAGGIFGSNSGGTFTSLYWDTDVSGQAFGSNGATPVGTVGLTTADMQSPIAPSTVVTGGIIAYENWDDTIWNFRSNTEYPVLRWIVVDTDGDGILDSVEDANGNGIVDPGETDPNNPDTDGDGISDGVEDANQDGIFDAGETNPLSADTDGDTLLDGTEDANQNGIVDEGETDPRLADTDGDGIDDATEGTGDADGDGIIDPLDPDPVCGNDCQVHTSTGGGSSDLVLLGLLGLILMRRFSKFGLAIVLSFGLIGTGVAEEGDWTVGVSWGQSALSPEPGVNTQYQWVDNRDDTYKVSLAYQYGSHWGAAISYADLGSVDLSSVLFGSGTVDYEATTIAGFYTGDIGSENSGADFFVKLGVSDLSNSSVGLAYVQDDDVNLYWAAGVIFEFNDRFDMRLEYDSYSKDSEAVTLGFYYTF